LYKKIYSNGDIAADCSTLNIPPYVNTSLNKTWDDFSWNIPTITYSVLSCSSLQEKKIIDAANRFNKILGISNFLIFNGENTSHVNFYCGISEFTEQYESETEYWEWQGISPAIRKSLYTPFCSTEITSTQFEIVSIYRALGLRNNYGSDTEKVDCSNNGAVFSSFSLGNLTRLYPFLKTNRQN